MTQEEFDALEAVRGIDLFGGLVLRWDDAHRVFTDSMGLPLSRSAVRALRGLIKTHLRLSAASLASCGDSILQEQTPSKKNPEPLPVERFL